MRGGNKGKLLAAGGVGAVIVALVALFGELRGPGMGGNGTGTGTGPDNGTSDRREAGDVRMAVLPGQMVSPATRPAATRPAAGPLKITVEGNDYLVDGQRRSLDEVRQLLQSKAQAEDGAVVQIVYQPNSRAKAEEDLKSEITKQSLNYAETRSDKPGTP